MLNYLKEFRRKAKWARRAKRAQHRKDKLSSFGKYAIGLLVNGAHGIFAVDPEDDSVSKKLLQTGDYNKSELELVKSLIPRHSCVLMVGTHIGALTIPLAKYCSNVVAIEANPHTFIYLSANLLLNKCDNVVSHNFAAGEKSGTIDFLLNRDNSGGSKRLPKIMDLAYIYDDPEIAVVNVEPLDTILRHKKFDLIFMDIEGSEYFAFKGMQKILSESDCLIVEFAPHHLRNVAGIGVDDFFAELAPHFDWMFVPKLKTLIAKDQIHSVLNSFYAADESHDGLVFLKAQSPGLSAFTPIL